MESYKEMKARHSEETMAFPLKFPVDDVQFVKMMHEWRLPLNKSGIRKLIKVGDGAYIRKKDARAFEAMAARHMAEIRKGMLESDDETRFAFAVDVFKDLAEMFEEDAELLAKRIGIEKEAGKDELLKAACKEAIGSRKGEGE